MPASTPSLATVALDGHRRSLTLHRRYLLAGTAPVLIDHVLSSQGGAYLIQERPDLGAVDDVRHLAERLESAISRPVDPVLVLTGPDAVAGDVRGVRVVPEADFAAWLAALPETVSRADMVLVNARVEKATGSWDRHRRIPDWEVQSRLDDDGILASAPAAARRPVGGPPPRAWSPASGPRPPAGGTAHPVASRVVLMVAAAVLVLALLGLLLGR